MQRKRRFLDGLPLMALVLLSAAAVAVAATPPRKPVPVGPGQIVDSPIPPGLPLMDGPTTCVSLDELNADGTLSHVGVSVSPSFKGPRDQLLGMMPGHVHNAIQFIGRTHGKSERWLSEQATAPVTFSPDFVRTIGDNPSPVCWCATPTVVNKVVVGCDFPCGSCERCVVPARP